MRGQAGAQQGISYDEIEKEMVFWRAVEREGGTCDQVNGWGMVTYEYF